MYSDIEKIVGHRMDKWQRKLIKVKGSFYVNIPKPIVSANGKKHGSLVFFTRTFDEKQGKIITTIEFE